MFGRKPKVFRAEDDVLEWFTVTYASILKVVGGVMLLGAGLGAYFYLRDKPLPEVQVSIRTEARFNWFEGAVRIKSPGSSDWVAPTRETVLRKNDLVRTLPGGAAEIAFFDGTFVHLRPDSLVTIEHTSEDPATRERRVAWHIASGEVRFRTGPRNVPGSAAFVSTPAVGGRLGESSSAAVKVAETGASEVRLFEGEGRFKTKIGQDVELRREQAVRIAADGLAGPKLSLPPPPVLAPPAQAPVVKSDSLGASARLAWRPDPQAVAYRMMLDQNATFGWPIVDRKGIKENAIDLRGLGAGRYFWRVAAVSSDDLEGAFSEYARLDVARSGVASIQASPPPLTVDFLEVRGLIAQVKGHTEPYARLTINGQRAEVQSDGSFNEYIFLEAKPVQEIVVQAAGAAGGMAEARRPINLPVS